MSVQKLIFSILLFSGIMIGMGTFYSETTSKYTSLSPNAKNYTLEVFNYTDEIYTNLGVGQEKIDKIKSQGLAADDIPGWFILGTLNAVKTFGSMPVVGSKIVVDVTKILGLPSWVTSMGFAIVLLIVLFAIIYAAVKVKV